ncbi:MAG: hypothetical protein IJ875_04295 [Solobacterium sp.]|nr:hypothetical protein [Solobacterium sp.]
MNKALDQDVLEMCDAVRECLIRDANYRQEHHLYNDDEAILYINTYLSELLDEGYSVFRNTCISLCHKQPTALHSVFDGRDY